VTQRSNSLTFVKPCRQDFGIQIVVIGKFGTEERLTVEPERVQPLKERSFIGRHRGPWKKECKESSRYLALKKAKVRRWDCWSSRSLRGVGVRVSMTMGMSGVCRVGVLAFQHSLV